MNRIRLSLPLLALGLMAAGAGPSKPWIAGLRHRPNPASVSPSVATSINRLWAAGDPRRRMAAVTRLAKQIMSAKIPLTWTYADCLTPGPVESQRRSSLSTVPTASACWLAGRLGNCLTATRSSLTA